VPLVDADWNEQDDLRRYELQAFLKWFVGNGVPKGNDGFRILAIAGAENTFAIQGGDGTPEGAGRYLVDGWDVINESTLPYTAQPLFNNASLAATWGVEPLPSLTTPAQDRTDRVSVDVWEREVDVAEDEQLVNPAIGVETGVRVKREWVVRVAEGVAIPPPPPGHLFYHLADVQRRAGEATMRQEDVTDHRLTGLSIVSYHDIQQTVKDAFGASYTLDHDSQPNLKISLRDAINALLRGGLPGTSELPLGESQASPERPSGIEDRRGNIWVFWQGSVFGMHGIWYNRYLRASDTWERATRLTVPQLSDSEPFALEDRQGDLWVFWSRAGAEIWYLRYRSSIDQWEEATRLTTSSGNNRELTAVADRAGQTIWVFWSSNRTGNFDIWYNRFRLSTNTWEGDQRLPHSTTGADIQPYAVEDRQNDIWVFWSGIDDIRAARFRPTSGSWVLETLTTDASAVDRFPCACEDRRGHIWLFWESAKGGNVDIWYTRYRRQDDGFATARPLTTETGSDAQPFAFEDHQGDVWVFWHSNRGGNTAVWYDRLRADGGWDRARQLTSTGRLEDMFPVGLEARDGDIWVFWQGQALEDHDLWYRTLVPVIDPPDAEAQRR
jgi:Family of unknown function (DUF6519)